MVDAQLVAVRQHADVRAADEDLLAQVGLQAVHHADDHDQGAHAHHESADRDHA